MNEELANKVSILEEKINLQHVAIKALIDKEELLYAQIKILRLLLDTKKNK